MYEHPPQLQNLSQQPPQQPPRQLMQRERQPSAQQLLQLPYLSQQVLQQPLLQLAQPLSQQQQQQQMEITLQQVRDYVLAVGSPPNSYFEADVGTQLCQMYQTIHCTETPKGFLLVAQPTQFLPAKRQCRQVRFHAIHHLCRY